MKPLLLYVLLIPTGAIILLIFGLFQHVAIPPVGNEYHYTQLFESGYTKAAAIVFFAAGLLIGYYLRLNPWLAGFCILFVMPFTSVIEGIVYPGSHNLIPVELIMQFIMALPSVIGVYIGTFIYKKKADKRKGNVTPVIARPINKVQYKNKRWLTLISVLFFLVPVAIWGLWLYVYENNTALSPLEKSKLFESFFPSSIQSNTHLSLIVIISGILSIVFASIKLNSTTATLKAVNTVTIILVSLILLLQLFSLM